MHHSEDWRLKALATSIAGLIFSLSLSALIAVVEVYLLPTTELAGGDLTMRIYQSVSARLGAQKFMGPVNRNYVFLDVDRAGCQVFAECQGRSLISEDMALGFVDAALAEKPKVVLIDWLPEADRQAEFLRRLAARAPAGSPSWIIAPIPARAEVVGDAIREESDVDLQSFIGTRLRLASVSTALDSSAGDGVIHHYPMLNRLSDLSTREHWHPTMPFAAAMLADPETGPLLECDFFDRSQCKNARLSSSGGVAPLSHRQARYRQLVATAKDDGIYNRIFYSLPAPKRVFRAVGAQSSSPCDIRPSRPDPAGGSIEGPAPLLQAPVHIENFTYACAGWVLKQGRFQLDGVVGADDIVVLGSSAPQSFDRQVTPIGVMSGAEVILNAARAMADFSPLETPRKPGSLSVLGRNLEERALAALTGFTFFLPAWFLIFWVLREPRRHGVAAALRRNLIVVALFSLALLGSLSFELFQTMRGLGSGLKAGVLADGLTPILALGLEGFAEGAKWLSTWLELAVAAGISVLLSRPHRPPPISEDGASS